MSGSSSIPSIGLAEFDKRYAHSLYAGRTPLSGTLEVTFRCNLNCIHCYCNLRAGNPDALKSELSTGEIRQVLDQMAEAGCLWLLITGGEPLLRKDFLDLYQHAKKKGFLISLFSNATLLTPEIADHLAEWPPEYVEITLYGATVATYEKITRVPGSFHRCHRGIELLREREVPLKLKTMAMTVNHHEIAQMKGFAETLGVDFRFDAMLTHRLDGSAAPAAYRLAPDEVIALDLSERKYADEWREFCAKYVDAPEPSDRLFRCGAGMSSFNIDPYGRLSACSMVRFQTYDLRKGSFSEGWHRAIPAFLELKRSGDYPCGRCDLLSLCGQCPGWAWMEHGNPETPVEYLCEIAHRRAEVFYTKREKGANNDEERLHTQAL